MKVLLICAAGMSTSLLVNNMKKFADADDTIEAYPVAQLEGIVDNYDVVLLGPQIRYKLKDVKKVTDAHGKPADVIDMRIYGQMKGKEAMEMARKLYKQ